LQQNNTLDGESHPGKTENSDNIGFPSLLIFTSENLMKCDENLRDQKNSHLCFQEKETMKLHPQKQSDPVSQQSPADRLRYISPENSFQKESKGVPQMEDMQKKSPTYSISSNTNSKRLSNELFKWKRSKNYVRTSTLLVLGILALSSLTLSFVCLLNVITMKSQLDSTLSKLNETFFLDSTGLPSFASRKDSLSGEALIPFSITSTKLCSDSVDSRVIENGTIVAEDLSNSVIHANHIVPRSIQHYHLDGDSVTTEKLAPSSVSTIKISDYAISNEKMQSGIVDDRILSDNSVKSSSISNQSILEWHISNAAVTFSKIALGAVAEQNIRVSAPILSKEDVI
jgi:hypothetical protein